MRCAGCKQTINNDRPFKHKKRLYCSKECFHNVYDEKVYIMPSNDYEEW